MPLRYFKKELVTQNQIRTRHGKTVNWQLIPGNTGLIILDSETDAELIEDLAAAVGTRGIIEINEPRFNELKKKREEQKLPQKLSNFGGPIRVIPQHLPVKKPAVAQSVVEGIRGEVENQVQKAVAAALQNTPLPGGDTALAATSVPAAKPKANLSRVRRARTASGELAPSAVPPGVPPANFPRGLVSNPELVPA